MELEIVADMEVDKDADKVAGHGCWLIIRPKLLTRYFITGFACLLCFTSLFISCLVKFLPLSLQPQLRSHRTCRATCNSWPYIPSQSHTGSPYKEKPSAHFQWNMISPSPKLSHCNGVGQKSNRQCKSTTNSAQETSKAFTSDQNNQHLKYNWKLKKTENPDKYANMHFVKSCKKEWPDRQGWPD